VPADKLAVVAEAINRFPEVTHNYEREHRYNHWFVVTAGSEGRLQAALGAIEQSTGYPLLRLPLLREYLFDPDMTHDSPSSAVPSAPTVLDEIERRLVMALQEGLPLFIRPFSVLASRVGCEENDVLERIRQWSAEGVIKRFGVVVRPRKAMRCWCTMFPMPTWFVWGTCSPGRRAFRSVTNVRACCRSGRTTCSARFAVLITTRFGGTLPICDSASNSRIAPSISSSR
jgi:DNA-binding Lrp family transcriptional regulator